MPGRQRSEIAPLRRNPQSRHRFPSGRALAKVLGVVMALSAPPSAHAQEPPPVPAVDRDGSVARDLATLERCLVGPNPSPALFLQHLRSLYLLAVEDESRVDEVDRAASALMARPGVDAQVRQRARGYAGAATLLRAKHGFWPSQRLRDLRRGLVTLDDLVEAHPEDPELVYLRLVSTWFLPGMAGRRGSAEADRDALIILLRDTPHAFPVRTFEGMVHTLLEILPANHPERGALHEAMDRTRDAGLPRLAPGCPA